MCGTSHLATASHTSTPNSYHCPTPLVPMPWQPIVTAEVHNANVCPSEVAERGANANGATEDRFPRANKHNSKARQCGRTEEGDMHGSTPPFFPPQPLPPLSPWLLPCHRTGYLWPMSAARTAKPMTSPKRMPRDNLFYCTRNLARGSLFRVVPPSEPACTFPKSDDVPEMVCMNDLSTLSSPVSFPLPFFVSPPMAPSTLS